MNYPRASYPIKREDPAFFEKLHLCHDPMQEVPPMSCCRTVTDVLRQHTSQWKQQGGLCPQFAHNCGQTILDLCTHSHQQSLIFGGFGATSACSQRENLGSNPTGSATNILDQKRCSCSHTSRLPTIRPHLGRLSLALAPAMGGDAAVVGPARRSDDTVSTALSRD